MLNNESYIGLMKSICAQHKQLGATKYAVFVQGAEPEPGLYLQHILNKMNSMSGKFMLIQGIDSGYPTQADQVTKDARCAFLILQHVKAQDESDHIKVLKECELLAEEILGMLNKYFKSRRNGSVETFFTLADSNIQSVAILGTDKSGARADFSIKASNSQILAIIPENWNDITQIGFPQP